MYGLFNNPRRWAKKYNYTKQVMTIEMLNSDAPHCFTCKYYTRQILTANSGQCKKHRMNLVCWGAVCDCYEKREKRAV